MAAWAEIVDEKTPIVVNNPDAEKPDEHLPAYDIQDVSETSDAFQNIVVYASNPNTQLVTTRHSVFDLSPRFIGVESSDPVRVEYGGEDDDLDYEVTVTLPHEVQAHSLADAPSEEASQQETSSQGAQNAAQSSAKSNSSETGSSSSNPSDSDSSSDGGGRGDGGTGDEGAGDGDGEGDEGGEGGEGPGDDGSGDTGDEGDSDNPDSDGRSARDSGGYGGDDITYDPGNRLELPRHADHVAAIGQTAVIAQAVGGKNAVVGMDEYTFRGLDAYGRDTACATSFEAVFGDELADGFPDNALLWTRDGMVPGDVVSIEKLVTACADADTGTGGTIVFPSDKGAQIDYFSSKQLESFQAAGIQLVPVDMSSPQGIIDGFVALGEVLSESDEIEQDAQANANQFRSIFNDLISAAGKSRAKSSDDGSFAVSYEGSKTVFSDYFEGRYTTRFLDVWATVADGYEPTSRYVGGVSLDASRGLLFSTSDVAASNSPLSLFMEASGVVHLKASDASKQQSSTTTLLNPLSQLMQKSDFKGYSANGPMSHMESAGLMDAGHWSIGDNVATGSDSVGSSLMPYLIVAGTSEASGQQIKQSIVAQSLTGDSLYSLYQAGGSHMRMGDILAANVPTSSGGSVELFSSLGCQHDYSRSIFHDKGVNLEDCVRVNPNGLIGSWLQGTPEAVLECAWLIDLYSKYPSNSDYKNNVINNMGKFKVKIGDTECTSVRDAVEAFYSTVYRCSLGDVGLEYADVVPDSVEGLNSVG